jgi:hypothetical protein
MLRSIGTFARDLNRKALPRWGRVGMGVRGWL